MEKLFEKLFVKTESAVMRINIDSPWDSNDFLILFKSIQNLYGLYDQYRIANTLYKEEKESKTIFSHPSQTPFGIFMSKYGFIRNFYPLEGIYESSDEKLLPYTFFNKGVHVVQIQYASPGFTDLAGISGVLEHLKEILMYYLPNKLSKEKIKIKEQQRIALQIENLKQIGLYPIEIKKIILLEEINIENLKGIIDNKQITSIEIS